MDRRSCRDRCIAAVTLTVCNRDQFNQSLFWARQMCIPMNMPRPEFVLILFQRQYIGGWQRVVDQLMYCSQPSISSGRILRYAYGRKSHKLINNNDRIVTVNYSTLHAAVSDELHMFNQNDLLLYMYSRPQDSHARIMQKPGYETGTSTRCECRQSV